ncbi:MAG: rhomboid family intramembrane serine protease [Chloroflexota bacterium]
MDLNVTVLVLIVFTCLLMIYRVILSPFRNLLRGWVIISVLLLVITGISIVVARDNAGYIVAIPWLLLFAIPLLGFRVVQRLVAQQRYAPASRLVKVLIWLHPMDGWLEQSRLLKIMIQVGALTQQGDFEAAANILRPYENAPAQLGYMAKLSLYRIENRWEELRTWLESMPNLERNPNGQVSYIRALGELGDYNTMVAAFARYRKPLVAARAINVARLTLFAFVGERVPLDRIIQVSSRLYPSSIRQYWLATADLTAGDAAKAHQEFDELLAGKEASVRIPAQRRRDLRLPRASEILTPESQEIIAQTKRDLDNDERFGAQGNRGKRPYATYALIAINVIVFVLEIALGGSTNLETLYKMGALVPSVVVGGEWWRLLAAMFLHYGLLHLLLNMLALFALGLFVEKALGIPRYVLVYFVTGLGSMLVIVLLTENGLMADQLVVGASGAIMGIVGAMGAVMYRGWRVDKAVIARERLGSIVAIVLFQVFIDAFIITQSSLIGHLSGAIIGFLVASLLKHHPTTVAKPAVAINQ